ELDESRPEEAVAIAVRRQRNAEVTQDPLEELEVPRRILGVAEDRGQARTGGVVDRAVQARKGALRSEPVVAGGIQLHEHARGRAALAPAAVRRRAVSTRACDPGRAQDPPDR